LLHKITKAYGRCRSPIFKTRVQKRGVLARNAKLVFDLGKELYKRMSDLTDHFTKVGKSLGAAVETYNKAVGSLETRVLVTTRKFEELGAVSSDAFFEDPKPVESSPRLPS
jgi:DNA recombination protein RmuC